MENIGQVKKLKKSLKNLLVKEIIFQWREPDQCYVVISEQKFCEPTIKFKNFTCHRIMKLVLQEPVAKNHGWKIRGNRRKESQNLRTPFQARIEVLVIPKIRKVINMAIKRNELKIQKLNLRNKRAKLRTIRSFYKLASKPINYYRKLILKFLIRLM